MDVHETLTVWCESFSSGIEPQFLTAPPAELIGSAQVAVRLPLLRFGQSGPRVCCCNYKSAHEHRPRLAFGPSNAIGHGVRSNSKPRWREFERQIQFGFHCKEP